MSKKYLFVFLFLIVIFIVLLFYWFSLPVSPNGEEKLLEIEKGDSSKIIAEKLAEHGLIKWAPVFRGYVLFFGKADRLQAGKYFISPSMDLFEITETIVNGSVATVTFVIPEGYTVKQIEERLKVNLPGEDLEGFLFPDTYKFFIGFSGEEAVAIMRDNFEKKISQEIKEEIDRREISLREAITMASLIEKEVSDFEDKKIVSGILWKRLAVGMPLQTDASLVYILADGPRDFNEIRKEVGLAKDIDSPYNTYKYLGLPPGPICNPGLESIEAAVFPEESPYWYYLSTPTGETIFSKTLEEHNIAIAKYLN